MEIAVDLAPGARLLVAVPVEAERQIEAAFLAEVRAEVARAAHRYAPGVSSYLDNLASAVWAGIDPTRLGRGGVFTFVDRVAYRLWEQARSVGLDGLTHPSRVTPPAPRTGEMPVVPPPARAG